MKQYLFGLFSILLVTPLPAQTITGKWKSIDDKTGEVKSIVEITERGAKLFGKIIKIFPKPNEDQDPVCTECPTEDDRYNKKILGLEIIRDMKKDDDGYAGGHILDPEVGRIYRCKLWIEEGTLKVRGYLGPFFRTQTWQRVP